MPISAQPRCSWMFAVLKPVAVNFLKQCWWVHIVPDFIKQRCWGNTCFRGRQVPEQAAKQKYQREPKSSHRDFLRLGHDRAKAHARESARKQNNCVTPQGIRCTAVTKNPYGTDHPTQRKKKKQKSRAIFFASKGSNLVFLCCLSPSWNSSLTMLTRGDATKCMSNDSNYNSCTTNQGVADSTPLSVPKSQCTTDSELLCKHLARSGRGTCQQGQEPT